MIPGSIAIMALALIIGTLSIGIGTTHGIMVIGDGMIPGTMATGDGMAVGTIHGIMAIGAGIVLGMVAVGIDPFTLTTAMALAEECVAMDFLIVATG